MNLIDRKNLLIISLLAETVFGSYGLLWGQHAAVASLLYLLASLVFIVTLLFLPAARLPGFREIKYGTGYKLTLLLVMLLLAYVTSSYWLDMIAIDPDYADMLPIMKIMNERFLHGD